MTEAAGDGGGTEQGMAEEFEVVEMEYSEDDILYYLVDEDDNETKQIVIYGSYESYGAIQKYIEDNGYDLASGGFERIPNTDLKDVTPEQRETLNKLTDLLEEDEDVTNVYTNMKPAEE